MASDKFQYTPLYKVMEPPRSGGTFEVVFRGSESLEEPFEMNEMAIIETAYDSSDLAAVSLSTDKLQQVSPSMSAELADLTSESHVYTLEESSPLRETHFDPFKKPRWWREASSLSLIIASMIIFCISITIALIVQILVGVPQVTPHAGIVSDDKECSEMAIKILIDSAASTYTTASTVDAAIMTSLCLMIKNPHLGGLGGGGFIVIQNQHKVTEDTHQINFREMSPNNTNIPSNTRRNNVQVGSMVAVPGYIRGIQIAHQKHGIAPWKKIFNWAADLAKKQDNVSVKFAEAISNLDLASTSDELKNFVTKDDNTTKLTAQDMFSQTVLSDTLRTIGEEGPDSFYTGILAKSLIKTLSDLGSPMAMSDMKKYTALADFDVVKTKYSGMSIVASAPPSSGSVLLSTLNTLEQYNTESNKNSNLMNHRMLEALKYSYGKQAQWSTASQVNDSMQTSFLSMIDDNGVQPLSRYLNGSQPLQLNTGGEQHVSIMGTDGLVVTIVMGIGSPFGSKIMSSGYLLNNAMLDFSWEGKNPDDTTGLATSQANKIQGSKRPFSNMTPVIVLPVGTKCGRYLAFDSHVGNSAISALTQFLMRNATGLNTSRSLNDGRINQDMIPYRVEAEANTNSELISYLKSLGHNITLLNGDQELGVINILTYVNGTVKSFIDVRDADNQEYVF